MHLHSGISIRPILLSLKYLAFSLISPLSCIVRGADSLATLVHQCSLTEVFLTVCFVILIWDSSLFFGFGVSWSEL